VLNALWKLKEINRLYKDVDICSEEQLSERMDAADIAQCVGDQSAAESMLKRVEPGNADR